MLRVFIDSSSSGVFPAKASRRWFALILSGLVHGVVATLLLSTQNFLPVQLSPSPEYKVVLIPIKPKERLPKEKLMWSPIPEVAPLERFGPEDTPHGERDPLKQVLIAQSKAPDSQKQLIHEPEHPLPLPADVPTPNLVALRVDNPPPAPKPTPKVFVPPPPPPAPLRPPDPHPLVLEAPPSLQASKVQARNDLGQFLIPVPKMKPKPFVPAAAVTRTAQVAEVAPMRDVPLLPPSSGSLPNKVLGPQAVIISLNPGIGPPPQGSRSAQFAKAPSAGTPSSGAAAQTGAVTVPGLIAHGRPSEPLKPPAVQPSAERVGRRVVKEIPVPGVDRTMSAPLRPSSRIIPLSVEGVFANRNVYALVIPGPDLPGYTGDWVMWFSERQPVDDPRQRISAPVPVRKYATDGDAAGTLVTATVQFAAVLDKNGRVALVKIIKGRVDQAFKLKAMQELEAWDFKPALRNGEPIEVDIVLEVPLQLKVLAEAPK